MTDIDLAYELGRYDGMNAARDLASGLAWSLRDTPHHGAVHDWAAALPAPGAAPKDPFKRYHPMEVPTSMTLTYRQAYCRVLDQSLFHPPIPLGDPVMWTWRMSLEERLWPWRVAFAGALAVGPAVGW